MPDQLLGMDAQELDDLRDAVAAAGPLPEHSSVARAENRELERRVLALERLLQALLTHIAESEPNLLPRLVDAFSEPLLRARAEDDTDIDSCAAALIGSALHSGGKAAGEPPEAAKVCEPEGDAPPDDTGNERICFPLSPVRYRKVEGIWQITRDRMPQPAAMEEE